MNNFLKTTIPSKGIDNYTSKAKLKEEKNIKATKIKEVKQIKAMKTKQKYQTI
jgi:hypothetical protein